jgi:hypothetical protein
MRQILLAATATVLLLAGCSPATAPTTEVTSAPNTGAGTDAPTAAGTASEPAPPTTPPVELPVIATRATSDNGRALDISLREVNVGERSMTVTFSVTNTTPTGAAIDSWRVSDFFGDGVYQNRTENDSTVDGMAVIDQVNGVRYLPARTADNGCMCSTGLANAYLVPGQTMFFTAVYQAVPAGVATVDVVIPGAGTFANVPIR